MKKFTKIAVAAFLMVAGMPGAAQNNVGVLKVPGSNATATIKGDKDSKFVLNKKGNILTKVPNQTTKLNEDGEMVTLTCNLIPIDDNMSPQDVFIYPTTGGSNYFTDSWENFMVNLPTGTYDMVAKFYGSEGTYLIVKENVSLSSDTEVTFDASEAEFINDFKAYNPDGELFTYDHNIYDEQGNVIGMEEGNVNYAFGFYYLVRKSDYVQPYCGMSFGIEKVHINQFSDRFMFTDNRLYCNEVDEPCFYAVKFYINGDDKLVENNPDDYFYHEEEFTSSKIGETSTKCVGVTFDLTYNGDALALASTTLPADGNDIVRLWVSAPIEEQNKAERIDMLVHPMMADNFNQIVHNIYDEQGNAVFSYTEENWQNVYAPAILVENGVKKYNVFGPVSWALENDDFVMEPYANSVDNGQSKPTYPGSPIFSFTNEEKIGMFGDNTPINMFAQFDEDEYTSYACCYLGRFGERRCVDAANCDVTLTVNGEQITSVNTWDGPEELKYSNMNNVFYPWMNPDRVKGLIDFTFDNQNIIVDGMQGRNFTTVTIDETQEDHFAPTMTMLQMRDGNRSVTNRFETAQDGKVSFSCGDFKQQSDYYTWFDCELPNVEVSVSPYGQDEWESLNITEDTEAFSLPFYGHVFNADICALNSDGWYDLKFKLTDAAGNWQEQIVSPAFLIGNSTPTGIEVVTSSDATEVARYTVDGRAISTPTAGVNIVKMSDGTVKKVLVK